MKTGLLVLASILAGLLLCEAGLRAFTHYRPGVSARSELSELTSDKPIDLQGALPYIARMPAAPGTDRRWFTEDPPPLPNRKPPDPREATRVKDYDRRGIFPSQANYIWNRLFVESNACGPESVFNNYPEKIQVFEPPSRNSHPIYRFPPNITTSEGLVTNEFGLRGPPLTLVKPAKTVRIAFLGASTTVNSHGAPYSYPEHVVFWLNRFSAANRLDVQFQVLNGGREGINSRDIAAIARYEMLPLDPDLAVYYEGSNQFTSATALASPGVPPRQDIDPRDPVAVHKIPALLRAHFATANLVDLALNRFSSIGEPVKPLYRLVWRRDVDMWNPDIDSASLPLQLPAIVRDLDSVRDGLRTVGANLVLCSFEWFTPVGVPLSPTRHQGIYKQLNSVLWPLRYADIRLLADFQNRVFRRYAESRAIPFIDVASQLPQDPNLFRDAIHMTETGERVKAWIVFQQLAPLIRHEIETGQLPRPAASHSVPPLPPFETSEMSLRCGQAPSGKLTPIEGGLSISRRASASEQASIQPGPPLKITTPPRQFDYAVFFYIKMPPSPDGRVYVHVRARALKGRVGIAVLDQKNNTHLVDRSIAPSPDMADIYLPIPIPENADALIVRNAASGGVRSEILIEDMELVTAPARPKN